MIGFPSEFQAQYIKVVDHGASQMVMVDVYGLGNRINLNCSGIGSLDLQSVRLR